MRGQLVCSVLEPYLGTNNVQVFGVFQAPEVKGKLSESVAIDTGRTKRLNGAQLRAVGD